MSGQSTENPELVALRAEREQMRIELEELRAAANNNNQYVIYVRGYGFDLIDQMFRTRRKYG